MPSPLRKERRPTVLAALELLGSTLRRDDVIWELTVGDRFSFSVGGVQNLNHRFTY
jgi:hypothetical protein